MMALCKRPPIQTNTDTKCPLAHISYKGVQMYIICLYARWLPWWTVSLRMQFMFSPPELSHITSLSSPSVSKWIKCSWHPTVLHVEFVRNKTISCTSKTVCPSYPVVLSSISDTKELQLTGEIRQPSVKVNASYSQLSFIRVSLTKEFNYSGEKFFACTCTCMATDINIRTSSSCTRLYWTALGKHQTPRTMSTRLDSDGLRHHAALRSCFTERRGNVLGHHE